MAKPLLPLLVALLLTYAFGALSLPPCPPCGSTPVPYPLSTAANCGDQSYKIRCAAGGKLMFDSLNNTYPIISIAPSIQRLTIEPSPILPNACEAADLPFNGLQLNRSGPFNVSSSNSILYFNCSESVLKSHLNCTKDSLCYTYLNATCSACRDAPCCELHSSGVAQRIQMRPAGCHAYTSFVNLDPRLPVSAWPRPAVELRWVLPPEPTCVEQTDCGSGYTCGPDPNPNGGVINRCFCNSGLRWDPVNGVCA